MSKRRHVLGIAATTLLGGCAGVSPTLLCERGSYVLADPFDASKFAYPASDAPTLVAEGVESGTATYRGFDRPPFDDGAYVASDGAFYRVAVADEARSVVAARRGVVRWEDGQTAPEGESAVAFESLPAVDRRALSRWLEGERRRKQAAEGFRISGAVPYPNGTAGSKLVDAGTVWVDWNGRVYEVTVSDEPAEATGRVVTYRFERVAGSVDAFETVLADRYLVRLTDLSAAAEEVLAEAIEGQYRGCGDDAGVESLRSRLSSATPLPRFGDYLVAYDGARYELTVGEWVR